jgi:hypothetical protein
MPLIGEQIIEKAREIIAAEPHGIRYSMLRDETKNGRVYLGHPAVG